MEDLRVLVVSDDTLARTGLALLLADRDGLAVSGQTGEGQTYAEAPADVRSAIGFH
jgi:DNA-binding NarL/FixJ family response regulator